MQTLSPWFRGGKALELGCHEGEMTKLLAEHFDDITVIEAAGDLIETARARLPATVRFVHATIEEAEIDGQLYEAIFLIHTLEHLDDRVAALNRIRGWLSTTGRLYVVVPNADAASRQIAVKMGLIDTHTSVTAGEQAHGHRCTYRFDTLEHELRQAGLNIEARGGIFFKPFANFQFDRMMESGIIDQAYLDGCYALGMQHPDLAASIYAVCGRHS